MGAGAMQKDHLHRQVFHKQRDRPHIPFFLVPHIVGDRLLQALLHDLFVHLAAHRLQDLRKAFRCPPLRPGDIDDRKEIC